MVTYAERATGIVCDQHGARSTHPESVPRSHFDDLAVARAHCRKVTTQTPTLECWIELPTGEKIGPITADQDRRQAGALDSESHSENGGPATGPLKSILRDILKQYLVNVLAIGVFVCATVRYCRLNDGFDLNLHLRWIALAFGGLVMFIASEEFSEWSGRYGVSRQHWLMTPAWYIRLVGGILLVYFTVALYRV